MIPTGTVTFVLTDVVDSTVLWRRHPGDMPRAMRDHEAVLRATFAEHGGHEFGTAGDSFAVAFSSPANAVRAAIVAQEAMLDHAWPAVRPGIRIGLHTGVADERDRRYYGPAVNLAARVCGLAGADQILVTAATAETSGERVDVAGEFYALHDIGERELRSFDRPVRLFEVRGGHLATAAVGAVPSSDTVPRPTTPFIGRSAEVKAIAEAVAPGGLVTITGLGGLGKTRTAVEVARACESSHPQGIFWVDLSPLSEADDVAPVVATVLGISPQPGMSAEASVADALKRRNVLVVLDNCEHVVDAVAALVDTVLATAPGASFLATSQLPIGLAGERNWPLTPMTGASDAVDLLVERAVAADAGFDPARWSQDDLQALCDRLDGLPLAIEMAATRLRTMTPAEILERLDDRFRLLRARTRDVAPRHRSMQAALDWSLDLLEPDARTVLDRLSVFGGSFDLAAAEAVCAGDDIDRWDVVDLLTDLVDRSLVVGRPAGRSGRFRLLETVRQLGADSLDTDERDDLRSRMVTHFGEVAEAAGADTLADDRAVWASGVERLSDDWDNLRDAFRFALDQDRGDVCDRILRAVWDVAFQTFRTEVGRWARAALALSSPSPTVCAMVGASVEGERESREFLERALAGVDESTPSHAAALAYGVLFWSASAAGDPEVLEFARRGRFHAAAMGAPEEAWQEANLASLLVETEPAVAAGHAALARRYVEESGNPMRATCIPALALHESEQGRPELGRALCDDAVTIAAEGGLQWTVSIALAHRALISLRADLDTAGPDLVEALSVGRDRRAWYAVWLVVGESIPWLRARGDDDLADLAVGYLRARGIGFGAVDSDAARLPAGYERWDDVPPVRRDDLIDLLLERL